MAQRIEDAMELAVHILALDEDPGDEALLDALEERYGVGIDMDMFERIANDLLRLTPTLASPLRAGVQMHAFGHDTGDGATWIALMRCQAERGA